MNNNDIKGGKYYEPYAGGAGAALALLSLNIASHILLNDVDYHIYCFWKSVLNNNERFIEQIYKIPIKIDEWNKQKIIYKKPSKHSVFEVGFSTFYLNRCNHSGILEAGPIGGYKQNGKWLIDERFNKDSLIERISEIGKHRNRIEMKNMDAIQFMKKYLPKGNERRFSFVYIDPPYIKAGEKLYLNYYTKSDHKKLAGYLLKQKELKWLVTYDDDIFIRYLYTSCQKWLYYLGYTLQTKRKGKELIIAPDWLILPDKKKLICKKWKINRKI
ncbi:MAG: DNA adenine methylase [Ignavibacteriae bacterium]|nr:MAG: DNA adenine methylase [Ignavibacteriota bacterium]